MKVLFLQSAHYADDDRVWYHQRAALSEAGCEVDVCGKEELRDKGRLAAIAYQADDYQVIIVDTPRALWAVRKAKHAKLVYDITEWYPSKKNLHGLCLLHKWLKAFLMTLASLWAGIRTDAFLFGEEDKAKPFRLLFPHKPALLLPYYPDLAYIHPLPPRDITRQCTLLYAGPLTAEKGWFRVVEVLKTVARKMPDVQWTLMLAAPQTVGTHLLCEANIHIDYHPYLPFEEFCQLIPHADMMLDLRDNDLENTRCLPIKIFYYMACGRLCIYTPLHALQKHIHDIQSVADLASDVEDCANRIEYYIHHPQEYQAKCIQARLLSEQKYNWDKLKQHFVHFITTL